MNLFRGLGVLLAGAALVIGFGGTASASGSPADDVVAAVRAAQPQLSAFYGQLDRRAGVARAAAVTPEVAGSPVAVNSLDPAFVAGTPGAAPASFAYYAVRTSAATGRQATVWVERAAAGWTATNFTTGTEELTYPAQAGGDLVFTEPQVNAWYRVRDGRVLALNDPARQRVGDGVPVAAYQQLVHRLYGDKLPGSAYRAQGKLGGYDLAAAPVPAPGKGTWPFVAGGALLALGLVGWATGKAARARR
ncbi:hypothetical protein SAMN05421837_12413 [Amycolatopsis pretoriensis]|uniref:LPXTG-motif cell wall anchor domain-containing protein n=1 Tax=Amycolatopsis pretoriensis TaxID=218821 RepID=A0A1H5RJJ1_9PSEU|nr:hypothetical protein [Amycolatopsis pretoriensis]SEF38516.1 hypothetical protein SAMN05421837_12413 [Amycolatopsis pretoriensis]